jgi:hypothetical protein
LPALASGTLASMADRSSEQQEIDAAAAEAAAIGGHVSSDPDPIERVDEAHRPLEEAGEGESEGFELAEQELIEHASHGDMHAARRAIEDAPNEVDDARAAEGGEADAEYSSELEDDEPDRRS